MFKASFDSTIYLRQDHPKPYNTCNNPITCPGHIGGLQTGNYLTTEHWLRWSYDPLWPPTDHVNTYNHTNPYICISGSKIMKWKVAAYG